MNKCSGLLFNISPDLPQFVPSIEEAKPAYRGDLANPHLLKKSQFFRFYSSGSFVKSLKAQSLLSLGLPYFLIDSTFINSKKFIYKLFFNSSLKRLLNQQSSRSPPRIENDLLNF